MEKISRIISLLLTFMLVFSMISLTPVWAQEASVSETQIAEATFPEETAETTVPNETEGTATEPTEVSIGDAMLFSARASYPNGRYRSKAVIWNCVNEKVQYTYNGKSYSSSTLLLHSVWIDDEFKPAYCIQPGTSVKGGSTYDSEELNGADPWALLDYSKQRGVSLAILYGYPNSLNSDDLKTQVAYQLATSIIVHEIILGWRQNVHPFACTNDSYYNVFGGGTEENPEKLEITSEFYSSIHKSHLNNEDVWYAYNYISDALAKHDLTPSFASKMLSQAPEYTMQANSNGTYSITLTDTNGILSAYEFTNANGLTFTKNQDETALTITTSNSDMVPVTISPSRTIPNSDESAFLIWDASNGSQDVCSLHAPKYDPVPAYFKLKLPTGKLNIHKETSDSTCLSGWQFEVYGDAACTELVSGPHTTDISGQIQLTDVLAGTYWVKETGNASSTVNNRYYCEENVTQVTITSGLTTDVTFLNIVIQTGNLTVVKTTDTGADKIGWRFTLYQDAGCTQPVYGPSSTDPNGYVTFENIPAGDYWVKEIGNSNADLDTNYTCTSQNPQQITVLADDTVYAYFHNERDTASITVYKTDPYQNALSGSHFLLEWSYNGSNWNTVQYSSTPGFGKCTSSGLQNGIMITDRSGNISFEGLVLGVYYRITEVKAPNGFQLLGDYAYEGMLTTKDEVVTLNVVNTPVFTLPHTGSNEIFCITAGFTLCLLTCTGAVITLKRKEF